MGFKKRLIAVLAGIALLVAVTGSSGIVADSFGLPGTAPAQACSNGSSTGGGC